MTNQEGVEQPKGGSPFRLLMFTTLLISGCSIVYELIISAVSSYLVGDATLQYSTTIGVYMFAMGIGSYLSRFFKKNLFDWFIAIEIGVGIFGGACALLLFLAHLYIVAYAVVMYIEVVIIGAFVGAEIPVLTRIIENRGQNLRMTLSSIFSFDYLGGLAGSIAFPLLLLPHLGYFATSFLMGTCNIIAAILILIKYKNDIKYHRFFSVIAIIMMSIMLSGLIFSENIGRHIEGGLYRDPIVLMEQSEYQKIVVTKHNNDVRLYIDGNVQFSSRDEYRYHEALVHIPMSYIESPRDILILGGGDGMAARELLKYTDTDITLVDLDPVITDLCRTNHIIRELNNNSLENSRVHVINADAYKYLESVDRQFDLIIVDLPDPNNTSLNKLYTNVFYRLCGRALRDGGVLNIQSTSPFYAKRSFWCINKTLKSEGFSVRPYHLQVPSFGDWGFNMAVKGEFRQSRKLSVNTRYLTDEIIPALYAFAKDEIALDVEINSMSKPLLITYYNEAVRNWE